MIEGFCSSNAWPPKENDIIDIKPNHFGIYWKHIKDGSMTIVYFKAILYDYYAENGKVEWSENEVMDISLTNRLIPSDDSLAQLREHMNACNIRFNYYTGKVEPIIK